MAFLAPLGVMAAEAAGPSIAAGLESLVGPEMAETLSPLAHKALKGLASSKFVSSGLHKLGNSFFGKKSKTARGLMKKGNKVLGFATGKTAHKLLGEGLNLGKDLGVINDSQAQKIQNAQNKAMSLHDTLSHFNKKVDPLSSRVSKETLKELIPEVAGPIPSELLEVKNLSMPTSEDPSMRNKKKIEKLNSENPQPGFTYGKLGGEPDHDDDWYNDENLFPPFDDWKKMMYKSKNVWQGWPTREQRLDTLEEFKESGEDNPRDNLSVEQDEKRDRELRRRQAKGNLQRRDYVYYYNNSDPEEWNDQAGG